MGTRLGGRLLPARVRRRPVRRTLRELDQFTDAAASAVQFDDAVVGLPHSAETVTLIYNTDIVDEAPETIDDMVSAMESYHDHEQQPVRTRRAV